MSKIANLTCRVCREDLRINNYKNIKSIYRGKPIKLALNEILRINFNNDGDYHPKHCCNSCLEAVFNAFELLRVSAESEAYFRCQLVKETKLKTTEQVLLINNDSEEIEMINEDVNELIIKEEESEIFIAEEIIEIIEEKPRSRNHEPSIKELPKTTFNPQMLSKGEKYRDTFYQCSFCEVKLKPKNSILRHMQTKHDPLAFPFPCDTCTIRFEDEESKQLHKSDCPLRHNRPKIYKCEICTATGLSESGMDYHKKHDHGKVVRCLVEETDEMEVNCRKESIVFHPRTVDSSEYPKIDSTSFICNFCQKVMKQKNVMLRHMNNLHNPDLNPHGCEYCLSRFKSEKELQEHFDEIHENQTNSEVLICDYCGVTGVSKKGMANHMIDDHLMEESKLPADPFQCTKCELKFKAKRYFTTHMVNIHNELANFQCEKCAKFFKDRKELTYHVMKDHEKLFRELESEEIEINLRCCKCNEEFEIEEFLEMHLEEHEEDFERTKCLFCVKILKTFKEFSEHAKFHAQPQTHICLNCKKKYPHSNYDDTFMNHLKGHKKYEIYRIKCKKCSQMFRSVKHLEVHDKIKHKKETLFICSTCGKSMSSSHGLDQHIRFVHNKEQEKSFECQFCHKKFVLLNKLKRHEAIHSKERPFICEVCGSAFKLSESLAVHMKRHDGRLKRNYACLQCDKRFHEKSKLDQHMLTHTRMKPHECKYCDRAYACKGDSIKHMQKLHVGDAIYPCEKCDKAFPRVTELREHQSEHGTK